MTSDVKSNLMELITNFKSAGGIEAALVTSRSGVNLASLVPKNANSYTIAAMTSALQNAADIVIANVNKGISKRVIIECKDSKIVVMGAGSEALFVVVANDITTLGKLLVEMEATASKIGELLN